ncbi:MAG: CCA tRNA nucleotidyltransferase [Gemmatimonadota bacterium]
MLFPLRLPIPEDVLEIAKTLEHAGFEAWCVGGAVRDTLLGEANSDFDIATSAVPEKVRELFRHTVPVGERFGTIAVRTRRRHHEVTTFRHDVTTDGRHAVVAFGASLDDDLARRDFTINAIAYHPLRHEWRDPFAGAQDLERRLLRAVGVAGDRFREDYLRILRGLRFAARFGFAIEDETWNAMRRNADGLRQLSAERVRDEWFKGLRTAGSIPELVRLWWESGAAAVWIPELVRQVGAGVPAATTEGSPGVSSAGRTDSLSGGIGTVTGTRASGEPRDPVLLTTLLCLVPVTVLARLRASNAEIGRAASMLAGPSEPESPAPIAVRRWLAAVGGAADDLIFLWTMRHGIPPVWATMVAEIRHRGDPLTRKSLAVNGADLQAAGIPAGPELGTLLDRLLSLVVEDPSLNTRETLLARSHTLRESRG